uniref:Superoxide dismutase [Cu-Zn] n=1 Tax=Trichobilharzia regenti TaxID=157069 RepID=A0AA85KHD2_TRIRE|nr:unnamed protein product [Trichobilharzia regenti]
MLTFTSSLLLLLFLLNNHCDASDYYSYSYSYSSYQRKYFDPAVATFTKRPTVGEVWFTPQGDKMYLNGSVAGLPPRHILGVHIHQFGGLGDMCLEAGPHFNPFQQVHGSLDGYPRHAGDLGNIPVGRNGVMIFNLVVTLEGLLKYDGFIGRALVIHAKTDDLGKKGDEGSRTTGNSGPRLACATIGFRAT